MQEEKKLSQEKSAEPESRERTGAEAADAGQDKEKPEGIEQYKKSWQEILADPEYRSEYDRQVQSIIKKRLRDRQGNEERLKKLDAVVSEISRNFGMDMQQGLGLPRLPYRLAVVSAPDAAGYRDFMRHLHENPYGFVFRTDLFPALMQGAGAAASIVSAMDTAAMSDVPYDALLVLRGGGARLDLACYDEYLLASHIAQFPVPVFTAVGHDQDVHVCDMVAWRAVKTPTALADTFIDIYAREDSYIVSCGTRLRLAFSGKIGNMESRLQVLEARIKGADPRNILKRGYVLALDRAGIVLKSAAAARPGDSITLMCHDGSIGCGVEKVELKDN